MIRHSRFELKLIAFAGIFSRKVLLIADLRGRKKEKKQDRREKMSERRRKNAKIKGASLVVGVATRAVVGVEGSHEVEVAAGIGGDGGHAAGVGQGAKGPDLDHVIGLQSEGREHRGHVREPGDLDPGHVQGVTGQGLVLKEVAVDLEIRAGPNLRGVGEDLDRGQGQLLEIDLSAAEAVIVKKMIQNPDRLDLLQKKRLKEMTGQLDLLQKKNLGLHQKKRLKKIAAEDCDDHREIANERLY